MSSDPLDLFRSAIDALNREDWPGLASLCDEESLAAFKRSLIFDLSPAEFVMSKLTPVDMMKAMPDVPLAVAEYLLAQTRAGVDPQRKLSELTHDASSPDEIAAMTPADLFALWLDSQSPRRHFDRLVDERRMTRPAANAAIARASRGEYTGLGFVHDGADTVHIVYRLDGGMRSGSPYTTMAKRQPDGEWLLVANKRLLNLHRVRMTAMRPVGGDACEIASTEGDSD